MVQQQVVITLNPGVTFQTMLGWEATAQAGQFAFRTAFSKYKDPLFDAAVNDLGINRVRLEIQNGVENPVDYFTMYYNGQISSSEWRAHRYEVINDNDDPFVINPARFQFATIDQTIDTVIIPIKQRLEARGEKLYVNLTYVDFGPSAFEHKDYAEEYAEFMLATFLHLRDRYGWTPDSIEIVLEADNASWNGTQVGQAIVATGDRLKANGFHPSFVAPSTTNMGNAIKFFDQIVQVPRATQYISELSYHRYGGVSDENLQTIGNRALQYGISAAHLELIGANYLDLHKDLTLGRNSSWSQFTLAWVTSDGFDDGGKYYVVDDHDPNQPVVQVGSRTKFLRQYFQYVRRGAVRIGAVSGNPEFEPLAFVNPDCKQTVIIKAERSVGFSIQGLPSGVYGVKYTTDFNYNVDRADVTINAGQSLQTSILAPGVITIYAKSVSCAPLVNVSAASYRSEELAVESMVAVFGKDLAEKPVFARETQLPTSMDGTVVRIKDSRGLSWDAPLFFVSPYQVNYQMPPDVSSGPAVVSVVRGAETSALGSVLIKQVAPGLFTADASGRGLPAAVALRIKADGSQRYEPIFRFDADQNRYVPIAIDLGPDLGAESDQVFLLLFGTGIRRRSALSAVKARVGDIESPVANAEAVANFVGLDQVALRLPRSLAGRGAADVSLSVDGKPCNLVTVNIK
ncbi:MAG TPA: hypothetical protein VJ810_26120 [Blastocatellia bacterium]|nr:hypothetical protein [Blastocatellia bacterium]